MAPVRSRELTQPGHGPQEPLFLLGRDGVGGPHQDQSAVATSADGQPRLGPATGLRSMSAIWWNGQNHRVAARAPGAPSSTPYPPEPGPSRLVAIGAARPTARWPGPGTGPFAAGCAARLVRGARTCRQPRPGDEPLGRLRSPAQPGMEGQHDRVEHERRRVQAEHGGHPDTGDQQPGDRRADGPGEVDADRAERSAAGTCGHEGNEHGRVRTVDQQPLGAHGLHPVGHVADQRRDPQRPERPRTQRRPGRRRGCGPGQRRPRRASTGHVDHADRLAAINEVADKADGRLDLAQVIRIDRSARQDEGVVVARRTPRRPAGPR